ncbi:hypothetical protein IF1G_06822 [Cordyceps javanica]|uniref:Uncharacterized protein n=1 Tax=Cordyceps javanica TaxID=43265 RepID=A0A545UZB3_9HYPO|nr:hypothetical protein IF1G_06822 [Cordyceps javanica]
MITSKAEAALTCQIQIRLNCKGKFPRGGVAATTLGLGLPSWLESLPSCFLSCCCPFTRAQPFLHYPRYRQVSANMTRRLASNSE